MFYSYIIFYWLCASLKFYTTVQPMELDLFWEAAGWAGAALVLFGYALVSIGGSAKPFHHVINFSGGTLLLGASAVKDAWFSVVLNGFWIAIALVSLGRVVYKKLAAYQHSRL